MFAIAFDRFRMVCQIKKKQLSDRYKWIIVGSIIVLTAFFNCSIFVTSGTIPVSMHLQICHIEHRRKGKNNVDGIKNKGKVPLNTDVKFPDKE